MKVYGADFSGAKSPKIHYAEAEISAEGITLTRVVACDDRLDLFAAIIESRAAWGLDFPFALTRQAYDWLQVDGWEGLLELATQSSREGFMAYVAERVAPFEGRCRERNGFCRETDIALAAYSGLKQFNPGMRVMTYAGLKLLAYLRRSGVRVYPFDEQDMNASRVYEVYPSSSWGRAGLRRTTDLSLFAERWNVLSDPQKPVHIPPEWAQVATEDIADSVVACVTLAAVVGQVEPDWQTRPVLVTEAEWQQRRDEGVIIRL